MARTPAPTTQPVTGEPRVVTTGFRKRVYAKVKQVKAGEVTTYGDVAGALGSRRVARQVGFALSALPKALSQMVPWQRVINSNGRISIKGEFNRAEQQRALLMHEGIGFDASDKVVDFDSHRHRFRRPRQAS